MRSIGSLSVSPELLSEITRSALERLLTSPLPPQLNPTDLLRATVHTAHYGAIRLAHPGIDDRIDNSGRSCRRLAMMNRRWARD